MTHSELFTPEFLFLQCTDGVCTDALVRVVDRHAFCISCGECIAGMTADSSASAVAILRVQVEVDLMWSCKADMPAY